MKLGILCSGGLGLQTIKMLINLHEIRFVFTDFKSEEIKEFCRQNELAIFIGNPRNGKAKEFVSKIDCEILISINYLFIIEKDIIDLGKGLAFNVHGSLLPKYRGRTPHVWSIINGETIAGITAHLLDEGCDTGDVLEQVEIPIGLEETGNDILKKYEENYLPLIERVIQGYEVGELKPKKQNEDLATYFGKRVPEDGLISWEWQKSRIYNWVRAQAFPYPGAYSFYEGSKLTIDEIGFSEHGFHFDTPNGTILKENPLLVKTPNGAVEIKSYRENMEFKKGGILR